MVENESAVGCHPKLPIIQLDKSVPDFHRFQVAKHASAAR